MNLYLAAVYTTGLKQNSQQMLRVGDRGNEIRWAIPNILESFHYIHKESQVKAIRAAKERVFLDSGAFSAFTLGVEPDLDEYCGYIKHNADIIRHDNGQPLASVMDKIGSASGTYENQCYMENKGVTPLPCFHYGDDEEYLKYYVDKYPYITLGGMVPIGTPNLRVWLNRIWRKYLTNPDGSAKLKVHGFGLTSVPLMQEYPWYSVDSSSWVQSAVNGWVYLPDTYRMIAISIHKENRKEYGNHFNTIPEVQQDYVVKEIEKRGFTLEQLQQDHSFRNVFNMLIFQELNKYITDTCQKFKSTRQELF